MNTTTEQITTKSHILHHGEIFRDSNDKYRGIRQQNTPKRRYVCVKQLCNRQQFTTERLLVIKSDIIVIRQKQTLLDSNDTKCEHHWGGYPVLGEI
jgi:hypothetical protein